MSSPENASTDSAFAAEFRRLRTDLRFSQEAVAEAMTSLGFGFHVTTVGKIERGDRKVTVGEAAALAGVLGVPLDALLDNRRQLGQAYAEHKRSRDAFVEVLVHYIEAIVNVAAVADQSPVLSDQDRHWLTTGFLSTLPAELVDDAKIAAKAAINRNGISTEGIYVKKLLETFEPPKSDSNNG